MQMTIEVRHPYRLTSAGRLLLFMLAAIRAGAMCWMAAGTIVHLPGTRIDLGVVGIESCSFAASSVYSSSLLDCKIGSEMPY